MAAVSTDAETIKAPNSEDIYLADELGSKRDKTYELIFFADIHIYPHNLKLLGQLLPKLKMAGYSHLYFEWGSHEKLEIADINSILSDVRFNLALVKLYPKIDEKLTPEIMKKDKKKFKDLGVPIDDWIAQKDYGILDKRADYFNRKLKMYRARVHWLNEANTFLQEAIEHDIKIICIDMNHNTSKTYDERHEFMIRKIKAGLKEYSSKGIVFTGAQHCIDLFGKDKDKLVYTPGIPRILLRKKYVDLKIRKILFPCPSPKSCQRVSKALFQAEICGEQIKSLFLPLPIDDLNITEKNIEESMVFLSDGSKKPVEAPTYTYFLPAPTEKEGAKIDWKQVKIIKDYVTEAGGAFPKNFQSWQQGKLQIKYFTIDLPFNLTDYLASQLNLKIGYVKQSNLLEQDVADFRRKFPFLSVKHFRENDGEQKYRFICPENLYDLVNEFVKTRIKKNPEIIQKGSLPASSFLEKPDDISRESIYPLASVRDQKTEELSALSGSSTHGDQTRDGSENTQSLASALRQHGLHAVRPDAASAAAAAALHTVKKKEEASITSLTGMPPR